MSWTSQFQDNWRPFFLTGTTFFDHFTVSFKNNLARQFKTHQDKSRQWERQKRLLLKKIFTVTFVMTYQDYSRLCEPVKTIQDSSRHYKTLQLTTNQDESRWFKTVQDQPKCPCDKNDIYWQNIHRYVCNDISRPIKTIQDYNNLPRRFKTVQDIAVDNISRRIKTIQDVSRPAKMSIRQKRPLWTKNFTVTRVLTYQDLSRQFKTQFSTTLTLKRIKTFKDVSRCFKTVQVISRHCISRRIKTVQDSVLYDPNSETHQDV